MATVLAGRLPLFASDGLGVALLEQWHVEVAYPRIGKRGRPRNPTKQPHPELRYVQVVKKREGRKLVGVSQRVVHGNPETVKNEDICTSLIERLNLTLREDNAPLSRKTLAFAKDEAGLRAHLALYVAYYHFVRPHHSLRLRFPEPVPVKGKTCRLWQQRNPAMSASLADHCWTLRELLIYKPQKTATN
jgi:hypothetical protein